jgi:hypothetical protein
MRSHNIFKSAVTTLIAAAAISGQANAEEVSFEKDILPIMKDRCMDCHRAPYKDKRGRVKNPKAGLRFDTAELLMKGSEDEGTYTPVIVAGKSAESSFYKLISLDPEDEDIMPPKGDALTKEQQELIKKWIDGGAKLGEWKSETFEDTVKDGE